MTECATRRPLALHAPAINCAGVIGTAAYAAPELLNPETPDSAAAGRPPTAEEEARILKADVSPGL